MVRFSLDSEGGLVMEQITNAGLYLFYLLSDTKAAEPAASCKGSVTGLNVPVTSSINTNMTGGEYSVSEEL